MLFFIFRIPIVRALNTNKLIINYNRLKISTENSNSSYYYDKFINYDLSTVVTNSLVKSYNNSFTFRISTLKLWVKTIFIESTFRLIIKYQGRISALKSYIISYRKSGLKNVLRYCWEFSTCLLKAFCTHLV